jgi:O-antigen/teichoic acid export membrane protein
VSLAQRLRSLAGESVVYGLSGVIARFQSVLFVPIYTRLFAPADYGVMSLINSSIAVVSIFVVLGLDNSAHRWFWESEDPADRRTTIASWVWCQLATATVFGAIVALAAGPIARRIVGTPDAIPLVRWSALTLPLGVLGIVTNNWLRMQRRPWATTAYALGVSLLTIGLTLLFVVGLRWGLLGVYVAQALAMAVGSAVSVIMLRGWLDLRWFRIDRLREMLRFALPLIPGALAYWVVGVAERKIVEAYTNTAEVGLYSVGMALASGVALVTGAFQQAWGPFAFSISNAPDARSTYAAVFLWYLWGATFLSAGVALFAPEILAVLATKRYAGASEVVGVLALGYVMIGLTYIASIGPSLAKITGPTGIAMTAAALLNVLLNMLLVPRWGKFGSGVATLVSQSVTPIYLFVRAQRLYPIPYRFGAGLAVVAVALLTMVLGTRVHVGSLWGGIALKSAMLALYVPLLFMIGLVTPEQLGALAARVRRRPTARPDGAV